MCTWREVRNFANQKFHLTPGWTPAGDCISSWNRIRSKR